MARILLVTHIYPPAIDGGSRVISKIGDYLQKHHHQILVLTSCCHSTDDFTRHYTPISQKNLHILRLPVYTIFHRPLKLISSTLSKGPIFKILPFLTALKNIIDFSPDLIIVGPFPTTMALYALLFKKITKAKLLINPCFHPTDPDFSGFLLGKALKSADYIWAFTKFEINYYRNQQISKQKLFLWGNGIDYSLLIKTEKHFPKIQTNLLYIGSFAAHKGLDTLIDSLVFLPASVFLTLAGQPSLYFSTIQKQISSLPLNIRNRIKIINSFPDSDLSGLIDSSTVLILPSRQESFGLVLIEAMARKTPILTSDIPELLELVNNSQAGLTFKVNNPQDLAQQIQLIISHPKLQKSFGENGFKYVSTNYTWDKIGKNLCQKLF
ncbi:MAG: Glycosyltransferase [Microgenomates group bacterium GW2011_GWA2_40_6]|nr:MAG: Glycosyltransferase [Microgenomates group bacterium GW2011_GWA2_40_6]